MSARYGKYRGTVVDNVDPGGRGRIQVHVPNVSDTSFWAVPCLPAGGPPQAQFHPPPIGAGVWVEFEGGDPASPVWAGNMWEERESRFPGVTVEEAPGPVLIPGVPISDRMSPKIDRPIKDFPFKVEAPDLSAQPNEVPIEPVELPKRDDEGPPDD